MKNRIIISSILTIAMCFSLIAGSTFALFTSESKVNIAVTSGEVKMTASIEGVETSSMGIEQQDGAFANGGSASFTGGTLTVDRMTPGDKVSFTIVGENGSTVSALYRYSITCTEGKKLVEGLNITVDGVERNRLASYTSAWMTLAPEADMDEVVMTIELPYTAGNEYQNLVTKFEILVEAVQGNADKSAEGEKVVYFDSWDGTADTSWYDDSVTTDVTVAFDSAEQIAGLTEIVDAGNDLSNVTIELEADLDFQNKLFEPIGSYRNDTPFTGTFDGNGRTISNFSQNTWDLDNGYYYSDCGLGFFGAVQDAHIKDVTFDGAEISGESGLVGIVAGAAYGECKFENITVSNCKGADYQYYTGGIVGWASGKHEYVNCVIEETTTLSSQWGDFGNCTGGIIGGCSDSAEILVKDCTIACRIEAYNDVTSAYQWYVYRNCGMIIGRTGQTQEVDGKTYAAAPQLTCENVTVIYGEWADYHYCAFAGTNYPYVRVEEGISNPAYSNPRYGHPTDANGNKVVDDNHVHNAGEDHMVLVVFDQLYGGGDNTGHVGIYGWPTHEGVTVIYNNPSKQ
jgi:hypothetical protein